MEGTLIHADDACAPSAATVADMEDPTRRTRMPLLGLDLLMSTMLLLAVILAPATRLEAAIAASALAAAYGWGRHTVDVAGRGIDASRGRLWPDIAWIAAMLVLLAPLLVLSPGGAWVAFPVMVISVHVLGPRAGSIAVGTTVALVVGAAALSFGGDLSGRLGYVIGPVVGGTLAIGVVLSLEAYARESARTRHALAALRVERERASAAERSAAIAAERARMARDIHDTLAQSLSAIELLLRTADASVGADDERVRRLIGQSRAGAADSLADARRLVADLVPRELDDRTLVSALERLGNRVASGPDGPSVTVDVDRDFGTLDIARETALLRIAQSALANVTQHAGATDVRVTLTRAGAVVCLSITDNGRGISDDRRSPAGGGFGLAAMRSRVELLGGGLDVTAPQGGGTRVTATLPATDSPS